ncbi:MAG: glycosyltransferase family 9 protein [Myxococcales bacterium]|nr:glycosyltransferase family 9 protein [Myxococcales bacterium]
MHLEAPRHILVVKASSLGDILHALPVSAAIKRRFPQTRLTWIVEEKAMGILEGNRCIDELVVCDFSRWKRAPFEARTIAELARFLRRLRALAPDVTIDLQGLTKSGLITYLSAAPIRISLDAEHRRERWTAVFCNRRVTPPPGARHVVDQLFSVLEPLGIAADEPKEFPLWISDRDRREARDFFRRWFPSDGLPRVAIAPGGGWSTKRWDTSSYADLADRFHAATGAPVVLLWGPGEESIVAEIREAMSGESVPIPPASVKGLLALIEHLDLAVGGDTGPVHMAAALGVSTVGVYGPSDPARNGPYGAMHETLVAEGVPCLGCFRRRCEVRWCMEGVGVEAVLRAGLAALDRRARPAGAPWDADLALTADDDSRD